MNKHKFKYLLGFVFTMILFFTGINTAHADVDYDINEVKVNATVEKDGSLKIQRFVNYKFDSDAHGVYYRQNLDAKQKLINPKVSVITNHGKEIIATKGTKTNNTYELTHDTDGYNFKLYHNIEDGDDVTVKYSYTITNAIINWRDTAELNYKIIGNGWDTDLDKVKIKINFNNSKAVPELKVWAHGPLSGYVNVNRKLGQAILTASDVPGDSGIEVHAIFPTSITSLNKNTRDKNHKKAILAQEKAFAEEANRKRHQHELFEQIISWVIIIIAAGLSLFGSIKILRTPHFGTKLRKYSDLPHNYEIPNVDPVTAQILDDGSNPDTYAFTAYLTHLAGKNRIKIENVKRKNYRITLVDPTVKDESPFLKTLFDEVGDGKSFTTKQMKKADLENDFNDWQDEMFEKVEQANLISEEYEEKYSKGRRLYRWSTLVYIVLFIVSLLFIPSKIWLPIIIFLLALTNIILGFLYKKTNSIYTQKGAEEANQVRGFEKMLDDIGNFKMKDIGELIFWEEVMPYAVAFGLSKKVIKQLNIEFDKAEIAIVFPPSSYYWYSGNFEKSFNSSLQSGAGLDSSSSGSSGGFSGGSSGGFGGGSGGGAF
ncbi:DUF2207 family protein [Lactobacillus sp. PSON]|uniref:DUF2207 family protein n=1 Tax=Lactobacillus sp. PSON TaxID=3455454 RepID=UPI0040435F28